MKRPVLLILLMLVLTGASLWAGDVKLTYFTIDHEGNSFIITWQADIETEVRSYELHRKTSYTATFASIQTFTPLGVGKQYRFKDDQVYKVSSEQVDYRLEVVYQNGLRQQLVERNVNYTPTAIRRTWGSIKAMFQ